MEVADTEVADMEVADMEMANADLVKNRFFEMLNDCIEFYNDDAIDDAQFITDRTTVVNIQETLQNANLNINTDSKTLVKDTNFTSVYPVVKGLYKKIEKALPLLKMLLECGQHYYNVDTLVEDIETAKYSIRVDPELVGDVAQYNIVYIENIYKTLPRRMIQPSENYHPYYTHDFGAVHTTRTPFDINFKNMDGPKRILIYIYMHGGIPINKHITPILMRNIQLNKYSICEPGQCAVACAPVAKHMLNLLADALKNNIPLDIGTMLKESIASNKLCTSDPRRDFERAPRMKVLQTEMGVAEQEACVGRFNQYPYNINKPLGENTTSGKRYFEKIYELDRNPIKKHGIFICNDWEEIDGGAMDNLLENVKFQEFMQIKYQSKKRKQYVEEGLGTLVKHLSLTTNKDTVSIKMALLSDILEFCSKNGKPQISIVDNSCSVFESRVRLTPGKIAMAHRVIEGYGDSVAKGITKRKKNKHTKRRKQTKGKGKGKNRKTR